MSWCQWVWGMLGVMAWSVVASAQIRVDHRSSPELTRHLEKISGRSALLVRRDKQGLAGIPLGRAIRVSERFAILPSPKSLVPAELASAQLSWSPPRRLLMDRARQAMAVPQAAQADLSPGTESGAGVIVGVVDSGVDLLHPDLRAPDGRSRASWWLDFSLSPLGFYPELEKDLGCNGPSIQCGILGATQINSLLDKGSILAPSGALVQTPRDLLGHGTHVASLALGNGASNSAYRGVAPEAELVVARVAGGVAVVDDLDVLLATRFIFERAQAQQMPAVVNLSLGGDFGPHDGRSSVAQALGDWVGVEHPGRAIVVAVGNSGVLQERQGPYPGPFGIHTQVHIPQGSSARIPVLTPDGGGGNAGLFIWIQSRQGDELRVGFEERGGAKIIEPRGAGSEVSVERDGAEVTLVNQADTGGGLDASESGAAILATGALSHDSVYVVRLEGHGTADLWVQSEGSWSPVGGGGGALFSRALASGTVTIPADAPELIAVGASLNRQAWPNPISGRSQLIPFAPQLDMNPGTVAFFSSTGPNDLGHLKPDVLAPGAVVAGAVAWTAQPTNEEGTPNPRSMFFAAPWCSDGSLAQVSCALTDSHYGVAVGTSMAAPMVSGAVALLLEQDPALTQPQIRGLLRAGSSFHPSGGEASGAGLLNVGKSLEALRGNTWETPSAPYSWMTFAGAVIQPSNERLLDVLVALRGKEGALAFAPSSHFAVEVSHGRVVSQEVEPGLLSLRVGAEQDAGGKDLRVRVLLHGKLIAEGSLPIAVDPHRLSAPVRLLGGCGIGVLPRRVFAGLGPYLFLFAWVLVRRARAR